jgi:polyhydroxybutyrate depolymerase
MRPLTLLLLVLCAHGASASVTQERYAGRAILLYMPSQLPPSGSRALVVVLHGGLGNAERLESRQSESPLNMDAEAEKNGFIVAYLNGTPVTRNLGADKLGWNAGGGCCGQSAANDVDDVNYIKGAMDHLATRYGIDRNRIYGMGHSNGAMMTLRVMCETGLYAAAVAVSGPLNIKDAHCAAARGKRILAIHGADDANVPIAGGQGTKGLARVDFNSEDRSRQSFLAAGAAYDLQIVNGSDHLLDHLDAAIETAAGRSIPQTAVLFFGFNSPPPPNRPSAGQNRIPD